MKSAVRPRQTARKSGEDHPSPLLYSPMQLRLSRRCAYARKLHLKVILDARTYCASPLPGFLGPRDDLGLTSSESSITFCKVDTRHNPDVDLAFLSLVDKAGGLCHLEEGSAQGFNAFVWYVRQRCNRPAGGAADRQQPCQSARSEPGTSRSRYRDRCCRRRSRACAHRPAVAIISARRAKMAPHKLALRAHLIKNQHFPLG